MANHILIFVFGVIIGSFLNVVILRLNTGLSVVYSGSRCFSCGKRLSWHELIPIFSFLVQKGRCRNCQSGISWQYPLVEFFTGLLFWAIFFKFFPDFISIVFYWLIVGLFIVIGVYDIRHQIIPDKIVYPLIFLSFGHWFLADKSLAGFLTGIIFFAFFFLLWLASKGRWMGLGDAKIALASGWLLGFINGLLSLLISFWTGAFIGVFLLLFASKTFKLKSRIPFGPFLAFGTIISILFGGGLAGICLNIIGRI